MPKHKDLKKRVRARMDKTGESYSSARSKLVQKKIDAATNLADVAGMSDDAVEAKTGKSWKAWVRELDKVGAQSKTHQQIAKHIHEELGVSAWWAQTVTVGYERIRGLREKGQRRGGGYDVNKSKTFAVPIDELYDAFDARTRKKWADDIQLRVKKASREKSIRFESSEGNPIEAYFWAKGAEKSQVQLQHRGIESKAAADDVREAWTRRLTALGHLLS